MNKQILIITFLICIIQCQISLEFIKQSEIYVRSSIEKDELNLENLYKEAFIYQKLADANTLKNQNACQLLKSKNFKELLNTPKDIYYFLQIVGMLPKCIIEYSQQQLRELYLEEQKKLKKPQNAYYIILLAKHFNDQQIQDQTCSQLTRYLQEDGTSIQDQSQPDTFTYEATSYILDSFLLCNQKIDNYMVHLNSILLNTAVIYDQQVAVLEKQETLIITSRIFRYFISQPAAQMKLFYSEYYMKMLNFLKHSANSPILRTDEKFELLQLYLGFPNLKVLVIKNSPFVVPTQQPITIQLRYENILGEQIETLPEVIDLKGNIYLRQKKLLETDAKLIKKENSPQWPLEMSVQPSHIQELGYYKVLVYENQQQIASEKILVVTNVKLERVEFEVTQGKGKIPKKYTHTVQQGRKINESIKANQNSFIYFQFALEFSNSKFAFRPSQTSIRLKHPRYEGVTTLVHAQYDDIQKTYLAIVDIGDPRTILPLISEYECEIIIADQRLQQKIQWNFVKFDISFINPKHYNRAPNDADFNVPKNITIQPSEKIVQPPWLFIFFFLLLMTFTFFLFLNIISKLNLNFKKLDMVNFFDKIWILGFYILFLISIFLLGAFWVSINLVQLGSYMCMGIIPIFVVGNQALNKLQDVK